MVEAQWSVIYLGVTLHFFGGGGNLPQSLVGRLLVGQHHHRPGLLHANHGGAAARFGVGEVAREVGEREVELALCGNKTRKTI